MALIAEVSEKCQSWLVEHGAEVHVDEAKNLSFQAGSTRLFIDLEPWFGDGALIRIGTVVLLAVPRSSELYEWVANNKGGRFFGAVYLAENCEGDLTKADVCIEHNILSSSLNGDDFSTIVHQVASTADDLVTRLESGFGGQKLHDD